MDVEGIRGHLAVCEECSELWRAHRAAQARLEELRASTGWDMTSECVNDEDWARFESGALPADRTQRFLAHAEACERCGLLLSSYLDASADGDTSALSPPPDPRMLAAAVAAGHGTSAGRRRWIGAAAAVAAVGLLAWTLFVVTRDPLVRVDALLAAAFSEPRTLELRFPDGGYAPLRRERGVRSLVATSPDLLEAEARIARRLRDDPDDPDWQGARARADLLGWRYDEAVQTLERLVERSPEDASAKRDLATAYFERAEAAERPIDYGRALDLLEAVLAVEPDNAVARFNRAVVLERMRLLHEAAAAWDAYLELDAESGWSDEARARRHALRERLEGVEPASPGQGALYRPGGSLPEERLQDAIVGALPRLAAGDAAPLAKLQGTASALESEHGDAWLAELVASARQGDSAEAIAALGRAVDANARGETDRALEAAVLAEREFRAAGVRAGTARALYERAYALQRSSRPAECLRLVDELKPRLEGAGYAWIDVQAAVEETACSNVVGELTRARASASRGLELAERSGYELLRLRAIGAVAGQLNGLGDVERSWAFDQEGLEIFWSGPYPPVRGYQFCDDMAIMAEGLGLDRAASAIASEAAELARLTGNPLWEAGARARLARLLLAVSSYEASADAFRSAQELFDASPATEGRRVNELYARIGLAAGAAARGSAESALRMLSEVEADASAVSNQFVAQQFYVTRAAALSRLGRDDELEAALRGVVALARARGDSLLLPSERATLAREAATANRELARLGLARGDDRGALELWQSYLSHANATAPSPEATAAWSLEEAQRRSGGAERLVYLVLDDGVQVWRYGDGDYQSEWVAVPRTELVDRVERFLRQVSDPGSGLEAIGSEGDALYELLLAPVASRLDASSRLLVQLDEGMSGLPIEALLVLHGAAGDEPPAVAYPFTGDVAATEGTPIGVEKALVVAAPSTSESVRASFGSLPPLADAKEEGEVVRSFFASAQAYFGSDATSDRLEAGLPGSGLVHFAGHAVANAERTYLLLSGDGAAALWAPSSLKAESLAGCRLVVLSACSTGEGAGPVPQGSAGLVRAFLSAGAERVVASRWQVDSSATLAMMRAFYERLAEGDDVLRALQRASASLRARFPHPYYWAGFAVYARRAVTS